MAKNSPGVMSQPLDMSNQMESREFCREICLKYILHRRLF